MLPLYLGALGLGGVLIVASIAMGGGDHDADGGDADVGGDADADGDLDGDGGDGDAHGGAGGKDVPAGWLPILSMRFWTFFSFCFGLSGTLLSALGAAPVATGVVATLLGVGVGWSAASIFRRLQHDQVSGEIELGGLRGAEARVLLAISEEHDGKVRVQVGGQDVDLPARTLDRGSLARGSTALVVEVRGGVAVVTPIRQLTSSQKES